MQYAAVVGLARWQSDDREANVAQMDGLAAGKPCICATFLSLLLASIGWLVWRLISGVETVSVALGEGITCMTIT